jgi:putative peptidoglycan lipid II flippase
MDKAVLLTRIMLISPLLFSISGVMTGVLNARQQFFLPALAPMLYNLSIIFGALALSGPWGIEGLTAGVVAGAGLHMLVQVPGLIRERMTFRFVLDITDQAAREVGRLMGPRVLGLAAIQLNFLITTFFASKVDDRAIANLSYAWVIAGLPLALFGMALSTAVFPRLAERAAEGDVEGLTLSVGRVLRTIMFFSVPAAVGLAFLSTPATVLLLQRGEFGAADASVTASAVAFYCLGLVPQAGIEIHSRGFYAVGDTRTPVMLAVLAVGLNCVLSALLWSPYGTDGLAAAVSVAAAAEWLLLYAAYARRFGGAHTEVEALTRFALAGALMAVPLAIVGRTLDSRSFADATVYAVAGTVAGGLIYVGVTLALGLQEPREVLRRVWGGPDATSG